MPRLGWITDPHLVFLRDPKTRIFDPAFFEFVEQVRQSALDAIIISGDISEAPELVSHIELLADSFNLPIHFVLGNHDFYRSSIENVRADVRALCERRPTLKYLSDCDPIAIAPGVGLVGHDGFADGRYGEYHWSDLKISDDEWIEDLARLDRDQRLVRRKELGDEAAAHLQRVLTDAAGQFPKILVVTHYPPYPESARYRGKMCDYQALPYFACKAVGDVLLAAAQAHPGREFLVLCGHTHERYDFSPRANLRVHTGRAEYGELAIEQILEF